MTRNDECHVRHIIITSHVLREASRFRATSVKHVFDGCLCVTRIRILARSFVDLTHHHVESLSLFARSSNRGITICAFDEGTLNSTGGSLDYDEFREEVK